jgi:hypothetical protein
MEANVGKYKIIQIYSNALAQQILSDLSLALATSVTGAKLSPVNVEISDRNASARSLLERTLPAHDHVAKTNE